MPLVTSKDMLAYAHQAGFAVGAFNADNMEMVTAIVEAATEERAPVIVQILPVTIHYAGLGAISALVKSAAAETDVPVVLHLDHGDSWERNVICLRAGFTSLMFDGSRLPYEENVAISSRIVRLAHAAGVPVEAELGKVLSGQATTQDVAAAVTDPDQALQFVQATGCDSLAIAVGSVHGMKGREADLDIARVRAISDRVRLPLVLHGASGVTDESVQAAIENGLCKVNVATYLNQGFVGQLKQTLSDLPESVDLRTLLPPARAVVKERVREKMRLFGASNRVTKSGLLRSL